jgi:hypothetical protein
MQRFEQHDGKHAHLQWIAIIAMMLVGAAMLMPAGALAQHHSSGHHGGHFGHSSSRHSFGFGHGSHGRHGGHGLRFGLHRGGHGFSFGHSRGHRGHGLHRGSSRLHGRSHRSRRHHGTRGFGRGRGHAEYSGYRAGRSDCETVHKRAEVEGRLATIEGLRCYDGHGDLYIVPESREIVEYHDDGYRRR